MSGDVVYKQPDDFVDNFLDLQDLFGRNLTNDLPRTGVSHLDDELSRRTIFPRMTVVEENKAL